MGGWQLIENWTEGYQLTNTVCTDEVQKAKKYQE